MIGQQQTGFTMHPNAWTNILASLYGASLVWTLREVTAIIQEDETLHIAMDSSDMEAWVAKLSATARLQVSLYSYDWTDYIPADDDDNGDDDPDDGETLPEEVETPTPLFGELRLAS